MGLLLITRGENAASQSQPLKGRNVPRGRISRRLPLLNREAHEDHEVRACRPKAGERKPPCLPLRGTLRGLRELRGSIENRAALAPNAKTERPLDRSAAQVRNVTVPVSAKVRPMIRLAGLAAGFPAAPTPLAREAPLWLGRDGCWDIQGPQGAH